MMIILLRLMMMNKTAEELVSEIKKIRNDMDAVKAYTKTIAEQMEIIAVNTTPAETPADAET